MTSSPDPTDNPEVVDKPSDRRKRQTPIRAAFLEDFPEHEALSLAVTAFENGNYAEVRKLCQELLKREDDTEVRRAATELLRRIEPDRLVVAVLWASFLMLALVVLWAYGHGH